MEQAAATASSVHSVPSVEFRFIEFNPVRASRGVEAARVAVIENGEEGWVWMDKSDVAKNMMTFGRHPELVKAYEAYGSA